MRWPLLILLAAKAALAAAPPEGALCFTGSDEPCRVVRRERVAVEARDVRRPFVWVGGDGRDVIAGTIAPHVRAIDLTAAPMLVASVAVDRQRWPVDVLVRLGGTSWMISGAAAEFALLVTAVDAGDYDLLVSADHHAGQVMPVRIADRATNAGRIALRRLPLVSGRIVDRATGEGVAGARIVLPDEDVAATAAPNGDFEIEIAGQSPSHLRVMHEGYGTRMVPLPKVAADAFLGSIALAAGASLAVSVRLPPETGEAVAELYFRADGSEHRVAAKPIGDTAALFDALATGTYRVLVRGAGPLERYGTTIELAEAGATVPLEVEIEPLELDLVVTHRRAPVAGARVALDSTDGGWRETLAMDDQGRHHARLWQRGRFVAFVSRGTAEAVVRATIGQQDLWEIRLPEHRIAGIVTDGKTGRGLANATVFLRTDVADTSALVRSSTDEQGRFEYSVVEAGEQTLTADAPGYLPAKVSFAMVPQEAERQVTLALTRAAKKTIRVALANGAPAVGALVATERDRPAMPLLTDATGRAEITVGEGAAQAVYVAPREGSFAIARVAFDERGAETLVTVPPGQATLVIRTQDQAMRAIPDVWIEMRYDGQLIPPSVLSDIGEHQGRLFRTAGDGRLVLEHMPVGVYEIRRAASADAPARIAVQPGTSSVILTFTRR